MPLSPDRFAEARGWLFDHLAAGRPVPEITEAFPELSVDDAFRLQFACIEDRLLRGETVVGLKAALTTRTMREMFGVDEPSPGYLTSGALVEAERMPVGRWVMANVEPEIAFVLNRRLQGPGVTAVDVMRATEGVMAAFEIGHLRYGRERRSLQQFLACNTCNGAFVLGRTLVDARALDLRREGMALSIDGEPVGSGTGVEAMGDPRTVVAWLANFMARFERSLEPGMVILTGSIVQGPVIRPGQHARADFTHLGSIEMAFEE